MLAAPTHEHDESLIHFGTERILPVAAIYGANSSGKSNVIKALGTMCNIVISSVKLNPGESLDYEPFKLDTVSQTAPTFYEMEFTIADRCYRYGFEFNSTTIENEWLYFSKNGKQEHKMFIRSGNEYSISQRYFSEGNGKENATAGNRLFISLVAQLNGPISTEIITWFKSIGVISGIRTTGLSRYTLKMFNEHKKGCDQAQSFFHCLDLGFKDLIVKEQTVSDDFFNEKTASLPDEIRQQLSEKLKGKTLVETFTTHNVYNQDGTISHVETFPQDSMESEGTNKIIEISGPLFDTLNNGEVLAVDELDAKLHPLLTRNLVQLFMNHSTNPNGAQLIFTTHDTVQLNTKYIRRDQIWLTEKDKTESTDLYSLIEFRDSNGALNQNDASIAKEYINGRYGAIPYLNSLWHHNETPDSAN